MLRRTRTPARDRRARPAEFIVPCQAVLSARAPAGRGWIHEIKHDGYRLLAAKRGGGVTLWTRQAVDYTAKFTAIAEAVRALPVDDCMLDGEAVAFNESAYDFHALRSKAGQQTASLIAFDLINRGDLRGQPVEARRAALAELLEDAPAGLSFSQEIPGEGPEIFAHACAMGLEGIVSKRRGSVYRSGYSHDWLKTKHAEFERP